MSIVAFLLSNPTILAIGGGVIAAIAWGFRQRLAGAAAECSKQAAANAAATTEGQKIDDAVAGRAPAENRERLSTWSKS